MGSTASYARSWALVCGVRPLEKNRDPVKQMGWPHLLDAATDSRPPITTGKVSIGALGALARLSRGLPANIARSEEVLSVRVETIKIGGMHCGSCVANVERAIRHTSGVSDVAVNLATNQGTVEFDETSCDLGQIGASVEAAGFRIESGDEMPEDPGLTERRAWRRRALIGVGCAAPVLVLGMTVPGPVSAWIQFALASVVQGYVGWVFYVGAFKGLKHLRADMDTLVAMGTSVAFGYSIYAGWTGSGPLFFDTAAVIVALIATGRWMESGAKGRASEAIRSLMKLTPERATVVRGEDLVEVSVDQLALGDEVLVRPGERIATDGVVVDGVSAVDASLVTGESIPVEVGPGVEVIGGAVNQTGSFRFTVTKAGGETLLAQIVELVRQAQGSKAQIQRLADSVAGVFVPVVLVVAAVTFLGWGLARGEWTDGMRAMIAVLIVACPCALGLATPTAIMVGTGVGAKLGILIKNARVLERAGKLDVIVLDKTGTITQGRPEVTDVIAAREGFTEQEVVSLAAAVEHFSEHAIAKAVVRHAQGQGLVITPAERFESRTGSGVSGRVNGKLVSIGRAQDQEVAALEPDLHAKTVIKVSDDDGLLGFIAVADQVKSGAAEAVKRLRVLGLEPVLLTGDARAVGEAIGRSVGIEQVIAEVRPAEKEAQIRRLQADGRKVAMVGDGINDAPALAAADVGIAMGTGTAIAMDSGDVVLVSGDVLLIPEAVRLSTATMHRIRAGLFWAFIYNVVLIPLAATGQLEPMYAAAAMSLSSVSVIGNALFLRRFTTSPPA